jgi:hypothetical protein
MSDDDHFLTKIIADLSRRYNPPIVALPTNILAILKHKWDSKDNDKDKVFTKFHIDLFLDKSHRQKCIDHIHSYFFRIAMIELTDIPMSVILTSIPDQVDRIIEGVLEAEKIVVDRMDDKDIVLLSAIMCEEKT